MNSKSTAKKSAVKPVYILFGLAVAAPLLALIPTDQDPDWGKAVKSAATSRRYGMRLAAAKKVAAAGAVAVPAITAYAEKNGRNSLPQALIDSIAQQTTTGDLVIDQLLDWAQDRDFYWRKQAFLGLARRASSLPDYRDELTDLFTKHRDDKAWQVATHSRLGLHLLRTGDRTDRPEDDPRLEGRLAALLLENGLQPAMQPLLDALADERTFLGTPWGHHRANAAHKTLKRALGDAHPGAFEDKNEALVAMRGAINTKFGQGLEVPDIITDSRIDCIGGIEVLSCRNGDLFVQWTKDGKVYEGIDARFCVELPASSWDPLSKERAALPLSSNLGAVICDKMRLKWDDVELHINIAPASLPQPAADWFLKLGKALEEADKPHLATAVRNAVEQFALH